MMKSEPGEGLGVDPAAPLKAWVTEELQSFRTSGRGQSDGIKPEAGDQRRTRSRRSLQVTLRSLALLLKVVGKH